MRHACRTIGGVTLFSATVAACSTGPSLQLTEANVTDVAAAAFAASEWLSVVATSSRGQIFTLPFVIPEVPEPGEQPCAEGGTITVISGPSTVVTFRGCQHDANFLLDGTIAYSSISSDSLDSSSTTFTVSLDISTTFTSHDGRFPAMATRAASGDYKLVYTSRSSSDPSLANADFDLSGSRLFVGAGGGGYPESWLLISDFEAKLHVGGMPVEGATDFSCELERSTLHGSVGVRTTASMKYGELQPSAGQMRVVGASDTQLEVTVLDPSSQPEQRDVELKLDSGTGSFGPPIWVYWATLGI